MNKALFFSIGISSCFLSAYSSDENISYFSSNIGTGYTLSVLEKTDRRSGIAIDDWAIIPGRYIKYGINVGYKNGFSRSIEFQLHAGGKREVFEYRDEYAKYLSGKMLCCFGKDSIDFGEKCRIISAGFFFEASMQKLENYLGFEDLFKDSIQSSILLTARHIPDVRAPEDLSIQSRNGEFDAKLPLSLNSRKEFFTLGIFLKGHFFDRSVSTSFAFFNGVSYLPKAVDEVITLQKEVSRRSSYKFTAGASGAPDTYEPTFIVAEIGIPSIQRKEIIKGVCFASGLDMSFSSNIRDNMKTGIEVSIDCRYPLDSSHQYFYDISVTKRSVDLSFDSKDIGVHPLTTNTKVLNDPTSGIQTYELQDKLSDGGASLDDLVVNYMNINVGITIQFVCM